MPVARSASNCLLARRLAERGVGFQGRDFRLTGVRGEAVKQLLA